MSLLWTDPPPEPSRLYRNPPRRTVDDLDDVIGFMRTLGMVGIGITILAAILTAC